MTKLELVRAFVALAGLCLLLSGGALAQAGASMWAAWVAFAGVATLALAGNT